MVAATATSPLATFAWLMGAKDLRTSFTKLHRPRRSRTRAKSVPEIPTSPHGHPP
uniref:Uncharacterized protein n=1 Tax=Arundo donax TaxID=35708 RepID=A0A0A8ZN44_ARUDO